MVRRTNRQYIYNTGVKAQKPILKHNFKQEVSKNLISTLKKSNSSLSNFWYTNMYQGQLDEV